MAANQHLGLKIDFHLSLATTSHTWCQGSQDHHDFESLRYNTEKRELPSISYSYCVRYTVTV